MRDESTQSFYEFNKDLSTVSDESLRLELEQSYRIINALSSSYHDVYYANLETGNMRSYRYSRITQEMFGRQFENGDFETNLYTYVRKAVHPDDQELFEPVLTRASIKKAGQLFREIQGSAGWGNSLLPLSGGQDSGAAGGVCFCFSEPGPGNDDGE